MGVKREKPEDLGLKLRQFEVLQGQGKALTDAVGQIGDTVQTYYRWGKDYGGMGRDRWKERSSSQSSQTSRMKFWMDFRNCLSRFALSKQLMCLTHSNKPSTQFLKSWV